MVISNTHALARAAPSTSSVEAIGALNVIAVLLASNRPIATAYLISA